MQVVECAGRDEMGRLVGRDRKVAARIDWMGGKFFFAGLRKPDGVYYDGSGLKGTASAGAGGDGPGWHGDGQLDGPRLGARDPERWGGREGAEHAHERVRRRHACDWVREEEPEREEEEEVIPRGGTYYTSGGPHIWAEGGVILRSNPENGCNTLLLYNVPS